MTAYARRAFAGGAVSTTLQTGMGVSDLSFTLVSATGWPGNAPIGSFIVDIDRGTTSEEKILCSSNNGTTVSVASGGRGYDGTTATTHAAGAAVSCGFGAQDGDEANQAVVGTLGTITTAGDLLYAASSTTFGRLGVGSNNQVLQVHGGLPSWQSIDGTAADIANVSTGAASAGSTGKLADAGHAHALGNNGATTSYTPTITASPSNPTLGNGTLIGTYVQIGPMVFIHIVYQAGTTSTKGSGGWNFALPVAAAATGDQYGMPVYFTGAGGSFVNVAGLTTPGVDTSHIVVQLPTSTTNNLNLTNLTDSVPTSWFGSGATIIINGAYRAA